MNQKSPQLIYLFQAVLVGAIMACMILMNPIQPDLLVQEACGCMECMRNVELDPWYAKRYNSQVPRLMYTQNSNLSSSTDKWWQSLQGRPKNMNYTAIVETIFSMFPDENHHSDSGPDRCRLCALVGNSGNLEGSHYGPLIDAHDFVIRINAGPTEGYERDVGSKTTHRAMYPESAVDIDNSTHFVLIPFKMIDLKWIVSIFTTKHITRSPRKVKSSVQANMDKVMILHPEFIKYVHENWLEKKGRYPSTGFIMLVLSLHICDQVNVFGFGASKSGVWHHYFDKKYNVFHNTNNHKGGNEYNLILQLEKKKWIHLYKGL
ncbi:CMP-N-acetylneuraminate-beta-galactosamide-alpha-2,3-sialyltransferase 2-like [Astyanax mexicanus]|uniref:CMP-N-acetylneuraminate-beta-galactosamide-alpha-2,3-sialyltransferase 1 n=1 Tax=Astyanax mexicanus TaxID=7994 RepID=A0A8T2MDU9_ASTMX|nr:CMP-N-acetylneuraminate-beta-galactosamide-alpha-2,3-sialyltransferase 2-like [Astyanax mexicanus]